ncbi:hypothetical protein BDZ97DRAFT_264080 [Flammula alnicola]|nr:hypothetical protein BDZ97DRAFT_264080 [Flammula alnicola]
MDDMVIGARDDLEVEESLAKLSLSNTYPLFEDKPDVATWSKLSAKAVVPNRPPSSCGVQVVPPDLWQQNSAPESKHDKSPMQSIVSTFLEEFQLLAAQPADRLANKPFTGLSLDFLDDGEGKDNLSGYQEQLEGFFPCVQEQAYSMTSPAMQFIFPEQPGVLELSQMQTTVPEILFQSNPPSWELSWASDPESPIEASFDTQCAIRMDIQLIFDRHKRIRKLNENAAVVPSHFNPLRGTTHSDHWSSVVVERLKELNFDKKVSRRSNRVHYLSLLYGRVFRQPGGRKIISPYHKKV